MSNWVDAFCARLDTIQPLDREAVDATTDIKVVRRLADTAIAGHAIETGAFLVTNYTWEVCADAWFWRTG